MLMNVEPTEIAIKEDFVAQKSNVLASIKGNQNTKITINGDFFQGANFGIS